jgi:hypothetical protein
MQPVKVNPMYYVTATYDDDAGNYVTETLGAMDLLEAKDMARQYREQFICYAVTIEEGEPV